MVIFHKNFKEFFRNNTFILDIVKNIQINLTTLVIPFACMLYNECKRYMWIGQNESFDLLPIKREFYTKKQFFDI